jgi:pyrimidine operon attenuation protein/uracil phosphoribosyltransferase
MERGQAFCVADAARVERILDRLADRIRPWVDPDFAILGVRRRGVPLARALARRLETRGPGSIRVGEIGLRRYDDALALLHPRPALDHEPAGFEVEGRTVLVVDDVLYTGRTLLRALEWLVERGAGRVHSAVLCARGEPEVPVRADFLGLRLDVGPGGIVGVAIPPYEPDLAVSVILAAGGRRSVVP